MENTEVIENTMENVNEVAETATNVNKMNVGIATGMILVVGLIAGGIYFGKKKYDEHKAKKSENGEVEAKDDNYVTVEVIDK